MAKEISLLPQNDQTCGWINCLKPRESFPILDKDIKADWTIIGSGYTGLSFARRMAELKPDAKIIVIDAGAIGEGASSRNSGFAMLNSSSGDIFNPRKLEEYNRINRINKAGLEILHDNVQKHNIECEWRDVGKFNCGAEEATDKSANNLIDWLKASGTEYKDLSGSELSSRLGTSHYRRGIWTKGDVLIQPAALISGLSRSLPDNVELYARSPALKILDQDGKIQIDCPQGSIISDQLILATNSFLHAMTSE